MVMLRHMLIGQQNILFAAPHPINVITTRSNDNQPFSIGKICPPLGATFRSVKRNDRAFNQAI